MRYGIPLLSDRVAPRCTFADAVLIVEVRDRQVRDEVRVPLNGTTWMDLSETLAAHRVETLVCGGISRSTKECIRSRKMAVIENVTGTRAVVVEAVMAGSIRPGFGFTAGPGQDGILTSAQDENPSADCLTCVDRPCLTEGSCPYWPSDHPIRQDEEADRILAAAWDVAQEEERTLCRIAELVYFGLELGCRRIGLAFCEDLREPADILAGVLRRFFDVVAVGCKARVTTASGEVDQGNGLSGTHPGKDSTCDPRAVAAILNDRHTDLNVLAGFCIGADSVFHRESQAPVTTVFLKDKSLANNPIGAVYSHYYLRDITDP